MHIPRVCLSASLGVALAVFAAPAAGQVDFVVNGGFEQGFVTLPPPGPLDDAGPDMIPVGWTRHETFNSVDVETTAIRPFGDQGPSRPGGQSVQWFRLHGGVTGDQTRIFQDLAVDAGQCSRLVLNVDTMVFDHDLEGGGTASPAFEWPVVVELTYRTTTGATQIWRHGWYAEPPGDGRPVDPGAGLIPIYGDEPGPRGAWDTNTFDLLAELPQVARIERIAIGGAGWNFDGAADNVEILCLQPELRFLNGRFAVTAAWRTPFGTSGVGQPVALTDASGYFWFFNPANAEVFVRSIDACVPAFDRFWFFAAGLTNVEVELWVHDLAADEERVYVNPMGQNFLPILDADAFATCDAPAPQGVCIEFDDLAVGGIAGGSVGDDPGETVYDEEGIVGRIWEFYHPGGTSSFGDMRIDPPGTVPGFGSGNVLAIGNLGVELDYSNLPFVPRRVTFDFADLGGHENLSIDRNPLIPWVGELDAAPCPIGAVDCQVTPLAGGFSRATFTGPIHYLRFGGQELWIDHLCAWR